VRQFVPAANSAARALLLQAGWWPVHHYFHMQIALEHAPPAPEVLARAFVAEHDTEAVWHLVQGAYAEVEGHLPQTLDGWRATALDAPGWDPALWIVRHDADGLVGAALGEEEGDTGIVTTVAVAHRARGRGHGRTLLLLLLEAFRERGLLRAEAAVHGGTAAAARLFESAGMTATRHTERWEKILAV
jgi:ribosomal protein S18 acetylase RimI-like enzyme